MNAVVMDDAVVGEHSIIGALSFVPPGMRIPDRSLAVGSPVRVIKEVSEEMIAWKMKGTELYQKLPEDCARTLKAVEPLREVPKDRPKQERRYKTWQETLNSHEDRGDA
jgi:phenylacetic acid degradation protein